eukprot:UN01695
MGIGNCVHHNLSFYVNWQVLASDRLETFVGAIYSPYTTYGQDEVNRYDTYYGDYTEEDCWWSQDSTDTLLRLSNLLSELINGQNAENTPFGMENLADRVALNKVSASRSVPLIN